MLQLPTPYFRVFLSLRLTGSRFFGHLFPSFFKPQTTNAATSLFFLPPRVPLPLLRLLQSHMHTPPMGLTHTHTHPIQMPVPVSFLGNAHTHIRTAGLTHHLSHTRTHTGRPYGYLGTFSQNWPNAEAARALHRLRLVSGRSPALYLRFLSRSQKNTRL